MKVHCLFLVLAVAAVGSEEIDFNSNTDVGLIRLNGLVRQRGTTAYILPAGSINSGVFFSDSAAFGFDSMRRTGNCTRDPEGGKDTYNLHFGFSLLQHSIGVLKIEGHQMSAAYRINDNSAQLNFTVRNGTLCYVSLNDFRFERLTKVEFSSSEPEYDRMNVDDFFEKQVLPYVNSNINKAQIEKKMQEICQHGYKDILVHSILACLSVLEHMTGFGDYEHN